MIKVDENDPVGELEPSFPYRNVVIKRNVDMKQFYELETEIGRGKFGTVYRCREKSTGLQLAAKFVGMGRRQERRNVEREVDIMRTLQHPRLIQLYDAFEISNVMCVIQELIEGGELFERVIDDDFILTEKACTVFVRQICEAVEFIHSQYILHLDLKPENILCLTRTGNRIKIIDFGLARKLEPDKKLQVLFGTPEFVAPEVVNFDQIGFGTDMWSVGVICYVLLSGLSPFMGETDVETMANVTIAQYDFDDDAFDDISDDAKDFISKLLMKNKELRLTASECLLHSWLRREPQPQRPPPQQPTRKVSGGLDSAKENLRDFVDRWSQISTSPQTIEMVYNAGNKDGDVEQSLSAEKVKILNAENGNNKSTLINSSNNQQNVGGDNIQLNVQNVAGNNIQPNVQNVAGNNIQQNVQNVAGNNIKQNFQNVAGNNIQQNVQNISGNNIQQNVTGNNIQQNVQNVARNNIQQNVQNVETNNMKPIPNLPNNNSKSSLTEEVKEQVPVKKMPCKTPSNHNLDKTGVVVSNLKDNTKEVTIQQKVTNNLNLKLDIEAAKKAVSNEVTTTPKPNPSPVKVDSSKAATKAQVSPPTVIKSGTIPKTPSGSNLKTDPVIPAKVLETPSPLMALKKDDKTKSIVTQKEITSPIEVSQKKIGSPAAENVSKQPSKTSQSVTAQQTNVQQPPIKQESSSSVNQQVSPVLNQAPFKPSVASPKSPQQSAIGVHPHSSTSLNQQKVTPTSPTISHGVTQSKYGNLSSSSSSDVKTPVGTSLVKPTTSQKPLEQTSTASSFLQNKSPTPFTHSKPVAPVTTVSNISQPSSHQSHQNSQTSSQKPKFYLSSPADDLVPQSSEDSTESDVVPHELRNVVPEMRHISAHKPKMMSQLSEPDLTKCTLQRNIPDKKPSVRQELDDRQDLVGDSRVNKPAMKHVPPKIHGIVLGQTNPQTKPVDDGKTGGPKVIMHKILVESRSEPLAPTSKENTVSGKKVEMSKSPKPITKSQTLSKLELNEGEMSADRMKNPSICNLVSKDRFDMRRASDFSCFLHNSENMEGLSLSEEIKKLSTRLFQKNQEVDLGNNVPLLRHSSFKNDPIGRFMANHGVIAKRPKYRLSNLNRDVPLGSPPPSSNIFYHLSHNDVDSDPHITHSAPQSPSESPERELLSQHSGLTRDVIRSFFGNKNAMEATSGDNEDNLSAASTIDSLASYFNRANKKNNISSFFSSK